MAIALILRFYARETPVWPFVDPLGGGDQPIGYAPTDRPLSADSHSDESIMLGFTQAFGDVLVDQ